MADSAHRQARNPLTGAGLAFAMPLLIFLPTLIFYTGLSSSLALGSFLAAIALLLIALAVRANRRAWAPAGAVCTLGVLAAVASHAAIAMLFLPFDPTRAALSLAPLLLVVMAGFALASMLATPSRHAIDRAVFICLVMLCAVALASILGVTSDGPSPDRTYDKPVFPFTEPSHLALVFTPLMLYRCVATTGHRRAIALALGVVMATWLQNLTLFVGVLLIGCISLRGLLTPALAVLIALGIAATDMNYYLERLNFSGEVQNLSNLVYVQGWQLIGASLERSLGWGLGFQQLGVHGSDTPAGDVIFALLGTNANLLDGGFTLSKLVSEFGFWGIALVCLYLKAAHSALLFLRSASRSPQDHPAPTMFGQSVIAAYSIELLVRGAGYFTSTGILLVASIVLVYSRQRARSTARKPTHDAQTARTTVQLASPLRTTL